MMKNKIIVFVGTLMAMAGMLFASLPSAQAANLTAPKFVEATTTGIALSWKNDSKAHHYWLKVSTDKDFKKYTNVDKYKSRYVSGLTQNTTYYIKYRVVYKDSKGKQTYSSWSNVLTAKTNPRFPGKFNSSYSSSLNKATIKWDKSEFAQRYRVMVADNAGMDRNVKNYYTTGTSYTVSLNSNDGKPKYVRVFSYNAEYMRYSNARLTVFPGKVPVAKDSQEITIATLNMLCVTCKVGSYDTPSWKEREGTILQDVKNYDPDVFLMQEGSNTKGDYFEGQQSQYYRTLQSYGYGFNVPVEKDGSTGRKNRIAYKKDKFTMLDHGDFSITGNNRSAVWVLLRSKETGRKFYAVLTHIDPNLSAINKQKDAELINKRINELFPSGYTAFVGGDMNSSPNDVYGSTHDVFLKHGWIDSAGAVKGINNQFNTYNELGNRVMTDSYGRIDYLYSRKSGGWSHYENVMTVDKNGKITSKHGSDHNMVVGITTIGK